MFYSITSAFLIVLWAASAWAQTPVLLGEREAMLANTGIARLGSSAAGYYNPAGLASIHHNKVAGSGALFQQSQLEATGRIAMESDTFESIPAHLATAGQWKDYQYAFSAFNPESYDQTFGAVSDFGSTVGKVPQRLKNTGSILLAGPSLAFAMNERWQFGASLFLRKEDDYLNLVIRYENTNAGVTTRTLSQLEIISSVYTVMPVLGAIYKINEGFTWGLRLVPPSVPISGRQKILGQSVGFTDNGGTFTNTSSPEQSAKTKLTPKTPMEAGTGIAVKLSEGWRLNSDANYAFEGYSGFKDSLTLSTGLEYDTAKATWTGGLLYKQNENRSSEGAIDEFYGMTMGRLTEGEHLDQGIALYYIFGNKSEAGVTNRMHSFGLVITSAYKF